MPQYLPLPDGSSVTIREGETPQQAWARAQQMYPEAFGVKAEPQEQARVLSGDAADGEVGQDDREREDDGQRVDGVRREQEGQLLVADRA